MSKKIAALPKSGNDCAFVQIACGRQADLVSLTMRRHADYCARHGMDYVLSIWPESNYKDYLQRYFDRMIECVEAGYKYIVFADSDCWVCGETDLREACPKDGFAATWHDKADWGDPRLYDHWNLGMTYMGAGPRAIAFLREWAGCDWMQHPWVAQHEFNQRVPRDLVRTLGHEWNCTPVHSAPDPVVLAWHGIGTQEQRYQLMKAAIESEASEAAPAFLDLPLEEAFERGYALHCAGKLAEAEAIYRAILDADPAEVEVLYQYALLLAEQKRRREAEELLRRCLAYDPNHVGALCAYGGLLQQTGRLEESLPVLAHCLEIAPEVPAAHWNMATPLLLLGKWNEGFAAYRYGLLSRLRPARFLRPEWTGWSYIEGQTLYLWSEQGFGDTMMALQLVRLVEKRYRPKRIILEVQKELVALVSRSFPECQVFAQPGDGRRMAPFDAHCSLLSLPYALRLQSGDLPAAVNYLQGAATADPHSKRFRVGVCWKGSATHFNDANRSIDAGELLSAFDGLGVDLFNLTYGAEPPVSFYSDECPAHWQHTADLIEGLDLVVTVDTSIAHLAGAMGKPTWVLVPHLPDWRWGLEGDGPRWYPSIVLFRQEEAGDWARVLLRVRQAMECMAPGRPCGAL